MAAMYNINRDWTTTDAHAEHQCRACGSFGLESILDLGETPLANALVAPDQHGGEARYPLRLVGCTECSLLQISHTVNPEILFQDYPYFSSFSDTMLEHSKAIVERVLETEIAGKESPCVVEIASNDGYLLQYYLDAGVQVLGIEPAENIAEYARSQRGIPTLGAFFGRELATRLSRADFKAEVIHANNVLAHVPDLVGVVEGIEMILSDTGVAIIEVPYARDLLSGVEFDTIYHEHLCYFSLLALRDLFARCGLTITNAELLSIHGGSIRIFARRSETNPDVSPVVEGLIAAEGSWNTPAAWKRFADRTRDLCDRLYGLLVDLRRRGARIAAYGASAKGSTLLNTLDLPPGTIDFVVDRSSVKQGFLTPGTNLPIRPPSRLLLDRPDYVLLLAWNFRDEIVSQQRRYQEAGGRFIIPVPAIEIL